MSTGALDPLIHHPRRLRILAALAALPDGDALAISRLQDMIGLPKGSPIARGLGIHEQPVKVEYHRRRPGPVHHVPSCRDMVALSRPGPERALLGQDGLAR